MTEASRTAFHLKDLMGAPELERFVIASYAKERTIGFTTNDCLEKRFIIYLVQFLPKTNFVGRAFEEIYKNCKWRQAIRIVKH